MNYHLHRDGKNLGVFSVEDLRRQREAGQLTGTELVWTPGMPSWQPLDSLLSGALPPPGPAPARRRGLSPILIAVLTTVAALFIAGAVLIIVRASRVVKGFRDDVAKDESSHPDGLEEAKQPIVSKTNTLTVSDIKKRDREFRVRQYLE